VRTVRMFDERAPSRIDPTILICVSVPIGLSRQLRQVSTMAGANDYRRQGVTSSVRNSPSVSVTKSSHARARGLIDYGVYGARVSGTVAESPSLGILSGLAALFLLPVKIFHGAMRQTAGELRRSRPMFCHLN